jgi:hypothetical protein
MPAWIVLPRPTASERRQRRLELIGHEPDGRACRRRQRPVRTDVGERSIELVQPPSRPHDVRRRRLFECKRSIERRQQREGSVAPELRQPQRRAIDSRRHIVNAPAAPANPYARA